MNSTLYAKVEELIVREIEENYTITNGFYKIQVVFYDDFFHEKLLANDLWFVDKINALL